MVPSRVMAAVAQSGFLRPTVWRAKSVVCRSVDASARRLKSYDLVWGGAHFTSHPRMQGSGLKAEASPHVKVFLSYV